MASSGENNSNPTRPGIVPLRRSTRRALSVINENLAGSRAALPCVVAKRGLHQGKSLVSGQTQQSGSEAAHRPITRKFGEQLSKSQQQCPEKEIEKSKQSISVGNDFGHSIFIDADDSAGNNEAEPMSYELLVTEEKLEEAGDYMAEVEMEDIQEEVEEEPIMDIDGRDKKNPLAVVEYVEDLYAYYRKMETFSCVSPDYMSMQCDINEKMRAILVDWLIEVHDKFDLMQETLYLTVNIIDRFLAKQTVVRKKLQLVGLVAMLLACKYEEVSVPVVGDLIVISDKAYTRDDFLQMLNLLQ